MDNADLDFNRWPDNSERLNRYIHEQCIGIEEGLYTLSNQFASLSTDKAIINPHVLPETLLRTTGEKITFTATFVELNQEGLPEEKASGYVQRCEEYRLRLIQLKDDYERLSVSKYIAQPKNISVKKTIPVSSTNSPALPSIQQLGRKVNN